MGFISTGSTEIVVYLTHIGAEYLAGKKKSANDLIVKYFSLGDSDSNYLLTNRLKKGFVPDLTGEDPSCLKLINYNIRTSEIGASFQRYPIIRDGDPDSNVIVNTFRSVEKSATVQKNDCVVGTGSTVTYTVPANTYSSTISQLDADNKALLDVETNKQTYANSVGTCI